MGCHWRRAALLVLLLSATAPIASRAEQAPQTIRLGFGAKSISPLLINLLIPEYLGWYRQEGLHIDPLPVGSNAAVMQGLNAGRLDVGVGTAAFQLPVLANGEKPGVNFFEYRYPFKWGIAVKPDSAIHAIADLRGKRIGVSEFGSSEYPIGQAILRLSGLDPSKDATWLAVGEGTTAGLALQRGQVDAMSYYDTGFGAIEAAGIKLAYLALPANVPKVGGVYLSATPEFLRDHRAWAVGFARAVAKAQIFIRENPEAAAYVFTQEYPEALPKGKSLEEQVQAIKAPIVKSMPLFASYDPAVTKWGYVKPAEWEDELKFAGLEGKIKDVSVIYTDALIDDINHFDATAIRAEAHDYKLPYKH